jgi:CTP:molybdopterin cytidylyltransferase MocA
MTADASEAARPAQTAAVILAAGAGTRLGQPKGLLRTASGEPWLVRATDLAADAGCDPVFAVVGARASDVAALLPTDSPAQVVTAKEWANGMAESLRAGLSAAIVSPAAACLILLVDMPDLPASVLDRILDADVTHDTLSQAVYNGRPGHPVLVGRAHWAALVRDLSGDRGARAYLAAHGVHEIECSDLFDGQDIDRLHGGPTPDG